MQDFQEEEGMDATVGLLHAMVRNNYERLKSIVKDMDQEEIVFKGESGKSNSTGQLLRHLSYVDLHWTFRIKNKPIPEEFELQYGPELDQKGRLPDFQSASVEEMLLQYDQVQEMFKDVCLNLEDYDLTNKVPYEDGLTTTIRWGIWHIADHNRYHQAHINLLKKQFSKK